MDVLLLDCSIYDIPSSRRVGAIVYDGASDMRLWTGPGEDRELDRAYGGELGRALDRERDKLGVEALSMGAVARVHPGRLHCDFLAWLATRAPETGSVRSPAPSLSALEEAVMNALAFVAERSVERVALPALGEGPGAASPEERLEIIVRAAHRYEDVCFAAGRPAGVEEVLVCEARPVVRDAAQRRVQRLAKAASATPADVPSGASARGRAAPKAASTRRGASGGRPRKKKEPPKPTLEVAEIAQARSAAERYDMKRTYAAGDHFVHPKFGVGRVEQVTAEGAIQVVFEDGSFRKMVHGRG